MEKMRIMMLTQDFPPERGGIQTYSYELAKRLAQASDRFVLVAPKVADSDIFDAELPFEVIRLPFGHSHLSWMSCWTLLKRREFDLTFHVQWQTGLAAWLLCCVGLGRPIFIATHGRELMLSLKWPVPMANWLFTKIRRRILRTARAVFPISHYTAELTHGLGVEASRISVVSGGMDCSRFRDLASSSARKSRSKTLLSICRLVPHKGVDTVLRCLPNLCRRFDDLCYIVGGEGPDKPRLIQLAREVGVEDKVEFLGDVPGNKLPEIYNLCDVFVLATRPDLPSIEGLGLVYLEAGACAKPVVGTRVGGVPDAVFHRETGLLVAPDNPEQLGNALAELLLDDELRSRLGNNGRTRILKTATWDLVVARLIEDLAGRMSKNSKVST